MSEPWKWLIFSYRVPKNPSTVRVKVWRSLKSLGALYIQQSVCVLPSMPSTQRALKRLQALIEENQGDALLIKVKQLANSSQKQIVARFNALRAEEYEDLLEKCASVRMQIKKMDDTAIDAPHALDPLAASVNRLRAKYQKIQNRDFFECEEAKRVGAKLYECEASIEQLT